MSLNLTRKEGEAVVIALPDGRAVRVIVGPRHGREVMLRFDAPRDIVIMRDEILPLKPKAAEGGAA